MLNGIPLDQATALFLRQLIPENRDDNVIPVRGRLSVLLGIIWTYHAISLACVSISLDWSYFR